MSSVHNPYLDLARSLDALPNGFPATPDGSELKLLVHLFTPEEAFLAAQLNSELELPQNIYRRLYATHDLEFNEFKKTS